MSDRPKSTRPDPDPPEPDRPELPECADPDRPAYMPDVVGGDYEAAGVVLRATYRVQMRERDARRLEQLAEQLAEDEAEAVAVPYLRFVQAAAVDLMNVSGFLDHWADQGKDGGERHEIPVAALVLETFPQVERIAERLMEAVAAAEEAGQ
jgi:hypothetical protein